MKTYTLTLAEHGSHVPEHPERTAFRPSATSFDFKYQVWSNAAAMHKTIEMQGRRGGVHSFDWIPSEKGIARPARQNA